MKITKFEHSCLLVEMPEPVNRTALFDPGSMSEGVLDVDKLEYLDDIIITHKHADHFSMTLLTSLLAKFPDVRITTNPEIVAQLAGEGITATSKSSNGIVLFDAPHEVVEPIFPTPEEIGIHYLDILTHPGDSHSFMETKKILALPVIAPWGSTIAAVNLALHLKPHYILPIHDWHWRDEARQQMYTSLETLFEKNGITFIKLENAQPVVLET
jgi:L-ascorbate metabolism protein UlaG (beta-lactamase superfamily)